MKSKKNFYKLLLFLLIVGLVIIIWSYISYKTNYQVNKELSEELYNYFTTNDLESCSGLFNYSDKLVNFESVDSKAKLCIAYQKANKESMAEETLTKDKKALTCTKDKMIFRVNDDEKSCTVNKMSNSIISDEYKKIFGKDIEEAKSFQPDNMHICYIKGDDLYCGLSETYTYVLGADVDIYRVIEKTIEKSSEIEIYDYFVKIANDECFLNYTTPDKDINCTEKLPKDHNIKYKFLKKYGTMYKHIYKKDDNGNYYWLSSEPIKK